jgi:hypothetical protein
MPITSGTVLNETNVINGILAGPIMQPDYVSSGTIIGGNLL